MCLLCYIEYILSFIVRHYMMFNLLFFFFKQKTAYEVRISDWSSDVCSSDLHFLNIPRGSNAAMAASRISSIPWYILVFSGFFEIGRASCRERVCQYV